MADAGFTQVTHKKATSKSTRSKPKGTASSAKTDAVSKAKEGSSTDLDARPGLADEIAEDEEENRDDDLMVGDGLESVQPVSAKGKGKAKATEPTDDMDTDDAVPTFAPISKSAQAAAAADQVAKGQLRKIPIPPHRMTPLKNDWAKIFSPLVEMAGLQVRMNVKRKMVELKSSQHTTEVGMLQKGADFVKAFALGFEAEDAIALLRMDDLFVDTFEIKDVKTLQGDHLARAIGRIAGKDGRTRFAIENASRTRVVLADTKIHILGSFQNIRVARNAVVALIMGSPPGKVYNNLKVISARQRQRT